MAGCFGFGMYLLISFMISSSILSVTDAEFLCGTSCICIEELKIAKCTRQRLTKVPSFENIGHYNLLDLRENNIKAIPDETFTQFNLIDVRLNPNFRCENVKLLARMGLYSDCPDVTSTILSRIFTTLAAQFDYYEQGPNQDQNKQLPTPDQSATDCTTNSTMDWSSPQTTAGNVSPMDYLSFDLDLDLLLEIIIPVICMCMLGIIGACLRKPIARCCYRMICRCCFKNRIRGQRRAAG